MARALHLCVAAAAALSPCTAAANPLKSLYTTIELKGCKPIKKSKDGDTSWRCEGLAGYPVYVAEGDLRQFVSMGARAEHRRAATQTLGAFNSIFERGSGRGTIEWRIVRRSGKEVPFAAIVHFHTFREGQRGDVLVVFKIDEGQTCHVAYVDALANPNAIVLARQIADDKARAFDCRREPRAEGAAGRSPM